MARGKPREQAILAATIEALQAQGYERMTMDGVAALAHASKATIYRRWTNKAELVKAALDSLDASRTESTPDTGSIRTDLLAIMQALREQATQPYVDMMNDVVAASRRDEALAALLREHTRAEDLSPFRAVLLRARRRRVLRPTVDPELIHDVAEAMIIRQLQLGQPFDDAFILRVVDGVLLPLLQPNRGRR